MKLYDFASKDKFRLSTSHGDLDYAHVIDEELNTIFNEYKPCLRFTKRELDEEILNKSNFSSVLNSFNIQKELNPKIWENGEISSKVRMRLLDIADEFINFLNIKWVKPDDIILTGSLANYNWSKYSDFDLHIVMDFKKVDNRVDFVKEYFDSKKTLWNEEHENLKIYKFPVELYVQDKNETHESSGIYSLMQNKWIKEPEKDELKAAKLDKNAIKEKSLKFIKKIDDLEKIYKSETDTHKISVLSNKVKKTFDTLKQYRKDALKNNGEMGIGNLIWKCLRRLGYLDKIFDLKAQTYDKINSLS